MRLRLTLLTLCGWLLFAQAPVGAIVIEVGKQRVAGFFESGDADQIVVRIKTPGGKDRVEVFERAKIKIIHEVDRGRLEKLTKEDPKAYQDYAALLAKQNADPEAKALATRLLLIAAFLDPPNQGRNCLLKMSALATTPADARKYRAMAYLIDPKNDPALLKAEPVSPSVAPPEPEPKAPGLNDFLTALKLYRSGDLVQIKGAAKSLKGEGVADLFRKAPGKMNQKDFVKACNDAACTKCKKGSMTCATCKGMGTVTGFDPRGFGNMQKCSTCQGKGQQKCSSCDGFGLNPYSEEYLQVILRAEIWALDQVLPQETISKKTSGDQSWSRTLNHQQTTAAAQLRLETITEYDPRACLFRSGKWVAP